MNRMILGALAALVLVAAGLFWWQGRAEVERGAPPPDLAAASGPGGEVALPSADPNHKRGAGLPGAGRTKESEEQKRFNRYDRNRDGKITRNEMMSTRVKAFQKLDTNHDNLLSFEEWAVKTSDRFAEIDTNHDGIITHAEFAAWLGAHPKKPKPVCTCQPGPASKPAGKPHGKPDKSAESDDDGDPEG